MAALAASAVRLAASAVWAGVTTPAAAVTRVGETTSAASAASAVWFAVSVAWVGATALEGLLEGQRLQRRLEQLASEDLLGASALDAFEGLVEGHGASVASSHHQRPKRGTDERQAKLETK